MSSGDVAGRLGAGNVGLDDLGKVVQQIDRITNATPGKPPSAYSIAKLLLILSGDVDEPENAPPARKLVQLLTNSPALTDAQVAEPQMILGLAIIAIGTILDRSFAAPGLPAPPPQAAIPPPPAAQRTSFTARRGPTTARRNSS